MQKYNTSLRGQKPSLAYLSRLYLKQINKYFFFEAEKPFKLFLTKKSMLKSC